MEERDVLSMEEAAKRVRQRCNASPRPTVYELAIRPVGRGISVIRESEFQEVFNNCTEGFPFIVFFCCFAEREKAGYKSQG